MADTLPNIKLPVATWVDLYAQSGLTVGAQIIVQNINSSDVRLVAKLAQPTPDDGHTVVPQYKKAINEPGDSGAWAFSLSGGGLSVRLA